MQRVVYSVIVAFLRLVTRVFFRTVEVVGRDHVPREGAVVFVGNHPNSLVDPIVITTTCGRRVRFAARDGLFSTPIRPILWALGSVPIRRKQDQASADAKLDNSEAFDALHAVLSAGDAFGIFPEGVSYTEPELQPLKTGAARIALSAVERGIAVTIVPVGLHYRRKQHFRGRVLVQFGRPIQLRPAASAAEGTSREAARALTEDIELALRALTLNAKDFDTLRVLDGVRRLYVPEERELSLAEEAEVTRRLVTPLGGQARRAGGRCVLCRRRGVARRARRARPLGLGSAQAGLELRLGVPRDAPRLAGSCSRCRSRCRGSCSTRRSCGWSRARATCSSSATT